MTQKLQLGYGTQANFEAAATLPAEVAFCTDTGDIEVFYSGVFYSFPSGGGGGGTVTLVTGTTDQIAVATGTTTPVLSLDGPHNFTTQTDHGILIGHGNSPVAATAAMTDGQLLIGQTGADPLPKDVTGDISLAANGIVTIGNGVVSTAKLSNSSVTFAKMQNIGGETLLGNPLAGNANVSEVTLGTGLAFVSTVLTLTGAAGAAGGVLAGTYPDPGLSASGVIMNRVFGG